ncbi:MAG: cell division protein ZapB [Spirochaetales bacterium]|uniref:Cell division protein ZapB n=1 Tax=Candidatus Thalassospirochaeta sargassi TaxID=3119039 RepID=A0AAJ1IEJ3_9SPIO|nr:cell division protein ZapB [Spirochaetales bacterium]
MLTVEQVKSLDGKVKSALDLIESLKNENSMLKSKLDEYKQRVDQLETVVDGFKLEQLEIEEGIKDVLSQLDQLEDQITAPPESSIEPIETQRPSTVEVKAAPQELGIGETVAEPIQPSEPTPAPDQEQPPELEIF